MKTFQTVLATLFVLVCGIAIIWWRLKVKSETDSAKRAALEQEIRDKYGDNVIIN